MACSAVVSIVNTYETIDVEFRTTILNTYKKNLKFHVESMTAIINSYTESVKENHLPPATLEHIKTLIHKARYDSGAGYFYIFDFDGYEIANGGDPTLEGKNLEDVRDANGLPIYKKIIAAAKSGGFVTYIWSKPNDIIGKYHKLGYVMPVKNMPWWLASGVYIDEIEHFVKEEQLRQSKALHVLLYKFILLTISLSVLSILISFYFASYLTKPIIYISRLAKQIASGDYESRVEINNKDELGELAKSFNLMTSSISKKITELTDEKNYSNRLFESIADGLVVTDENNKIVQINSAGAKIFAYEKNELMNQQLSILFSDKNLQLHGKQNVYYEVKGITKEGFEKQHLMISISSVIEREGMIKLKIYSIKEMEEKYQLEEKIKKMDNLKKYLPVQIVEQLITKTTVMAYERKKVTIFFSDLVNFTDLSDSIEPEEITSLLREYFTSMSAIVYKYSGTLDKFIGDAVMVFFGAPTSNGVKQDAINCITMACEMQEKLIELNQSWNLASPLKMRIGINTGFVSVGNFGSETRFEYTVIGTPVNVAARLEHACPVSGILISYETAQYVKDNFQLQEMDPCKLKGIRNLVKTFQVVGKLPIASSTIV